MSDTQIIPLATILLNCLQAAVEDNPNPPASIAFRIGDQVIHDLGPDTDLCCSGLAYVSFGDVVPSSVFAQADTERQASAKCPFPSWAVQLRAGIVRCSPTGDEQGNPPTDDDWLSAFVTVADDSQALRRTACCFRSCVTSSDNPDLLGMGVIIEAQRQGQILGGCMERFFTVQVQMINKDCC